MAFSYSDIWDDAVAMLRADAALLLSVAGVFLFLPALLMAYLLPAPNVPPEQALHAMQAYYLDNWPWVALSALVNMVGAVALLQLLLGPRGQTVGDAIGNSARLVPSYFAASFLSGMAVAIALVIILIPLALIFGDRSAFAGPASLVILLCLAVPCIYAFGRLLMIGPAIVAERKLNPFAAILRSVELTKGRGWAAIGLVFVVFFAGSVVALAISYVAGALFLLAAGEGLGGFLVLIVRALLDAIVAIILAALIAAIYRRLAGSISGI